MLVSAANKSRPFTRAKPRGDDPNGPGRRSATSAMPWAVPSDVHSSLPVPFPVAAKYSCPPYTVSSLIALPKIPPVVPTFNVPLSERSVVHRLPPRVSSLAEK